MDMPLFLVGEDALCCALGSALLLQAGLQASDVTQAIKGGAGPFRAHIPRMNQIAARLPVLMIADGDQAACVVTQINAWLPRPKNPMLVLRLAVREAEAWALADSEGFSAFTELSPARLPRAPDDLDDAKQALLNLVSRSRRRVLRQEMLPSRHSRSKIGLGYNQHMQEFISQYWNPDRAAQRSPSLARAIPRIRGLLEQAI